MLQSSLSKILSTISLSALSIGLLSGALSSSCKAMDLDPLERKAVALTRKSLDELNAKAAKLFEKAETNNERKGYILGRIPFLTTLAEIIQQPDDAEGLKKTMLLSAALDYYKEKRLEETYLPKPKTFKLENASLPEIEVEIKRLTASIASLPEIQKECISPQIGALKAYRSLKFNNTPQYLLQDALVSYYAASDAWKELEKNTLTVKTNEKEKEKTGSTVSVTPNAPQPISLSKFVNDGLDDVTDDEDYVDGNHTWRLVLTAGAIHNIPVALDQWQFKPELDPNQPTKAKLITEDDDSFKALRKAEKSVVGSYGVRYTLFNPTTQETRSNQFFMVLKK